MLRCFPALRHARSSAGLPALLPGLLLGLLLLPGVFPAPHSRAEGTAPAPFAELEKAVKGALTHEDPAVRARAFDVLADCRDPKAVDLVVRSIADLEGEQLRIRDEQTRIELIYEALFSEKERADEWLEASAKSPREFDRYNAQVRKIKKKLDKARDDGRKLENDFTRTRGQIDAGVATMGKVLQNLSAEDLTGALAYLETQWLASKNPQDPLRWLDSVSALDRPTIGARIAALLPRSDVGIEVRAAALQSLGARGDPQALGLATAALAAGTPFDLTVAAIEALKALHVKESIPPLIDLLKRADLGRLREDAHMALASLTGQPHGPYHEPWAKWWEESGAAFVPPESPVARPEAGAGQDGVTFYGIHTFSDRILFILDISGTMKWAADGKNEEAPEGSQRIDVAKKELLGAILSLDPTARFNVIFFNHEVVRWQGRMVEATEANKRRVKKWVEDQRPMGGTNVHDALEAGYGMALRSTGAPELDTIYFLTDGTPTAGKVQDPEQILASVAEWQKSARLRIHCVGVALDTKDQTFLRSLARIGGGDFVAR